VLNGELALSLLGGGGSLLSGSTGAPTMSALAAFKSYQKDEVSARKTFAAREDIQRDISAFKKSAAKLESVDDLLKDRKTLGFLLQSFGLESEINNPGKLKAIINSDPDDVNSFANRLADSRFGELAKFLDTTEFGVSNLKVSDKQTKVIDNYLTTAFEKSLAAQNPAARDALFFLRRIGTVENTFEILGDLPLRTIVTEALNLPREIARQSVDKQASLIEAKLNLEDFRTTTTAVGSKSRLDILGADLTTIGNTASVIAKSKTTLDGIVGKLEDLRTKLQDYDAVVDPAGVNAAEIPVQLQAIPDLLQQRGLVSAANIAVQDTRSALTELESLFNKARSADDADELANIQSQFTALADKVLGDDGYINGATYTDQNAGVTQNLLRNGTGGALPAGTDASPAQFSTTVATDGTKAVTKSTDLAGFLTDLQSFRDAVAGADFATLQSDLNAATASLDTAKTAFKAAEFQTQINVSSINNALKAVDFAAELDTQSLGLGLESIRDASKRAETISGVLDTIRQLAKDAQKPDADLTAINANYSARVSQLQDLIQNAGSVTNGTTTVALDNLLSGGAQNYTVTGATVLQAEGGDLANDILAGLPASITVGNAAGLEADVKDVYKVALDEVVDGLTRDLGVFDFATGTLDPKGALDSEIRLLQQGLDKQIADAAVGGKNLLSPFAGDLRLALDSLGSVLTVDAQSGFKDDFTAKLEGYATTVLTGGSIDDRLKALNDALFTAGRAQSKLQAEGYALNMQRTILTEEQKILEGEGGGASSFLKPVEYTSAALKFIERYLVQKDLESQGFSTASGSYNAQAAIASQIGSILPQGSGLNFLA